MMPGGRVLRLVGVYNASGTVMGEVRYWLASRFAGAHCALCDITHSSIREKSEWSQCRAGLGVDFDTVHLDERDDALLAATEGDTPCVVAQTDLGFVVLLGPDELAACDGSVEALMAAIPTAANRHGVSLPA